MTEYMAMAKEELREVRRVSPSAAVEIAQTAAIIALGERIELMVAEDKRAAYRRGWDDAIREMMGVVETDVTPEPERDALVLPELPDGMDGRGDED